MRLLIVGLGSLVAEHVRSVEELQKNHEIAYWVRMREVIPLDESQFPHTVFHEYRDALKGVAPKDMDSSGFEPLSAGEIADFCGTESELMSMMDKWYPDWPVNRRKDFHYDLLRYWRGVLGRFSPECVIFHAPPHEMFSFVLYEVAKKAGIPTVVIDCIMRQDRLIIYKDYREGNEVLAEAYGSVTGKKATARIGDISDYAREYYLELSRSRNPTPRYVASWAKQTTGFGKLRREAKALIRFIKDGTVYERAVSRFFKVFKPSAADEHRKYEKQPDFSKPYVYVPLHYQPECTTSPQGGVFVDQLLMVKMLSAALPRGWELYVKEHPAQLAHGNKYTPFRWKGFFETIAELPNVRLVPIHTNTYELADTSKAVATISGTAGWEAITRGKPALVFGYPWFMHAPGVLRVSSVAECRDAFARIEKGYAPDTTELFGYLALVDKVGFRGYTNASPKAIATFDEDTAVRDMHKALEAALSS